MQHAGGEANLVLPDLGSDAVKLEISLGSASQARRGAPLKPSRHLGDVVPDRTGGSSAVETHGTLHWLRHKDGPSRVLEATPGVRARLPAERIVEAGHGMLFVHDEYRRQPAGIKNNGVWFRSLTARGIWAWLAAVTPASRIADATSPSR